MSHKMSSFNSGWPIISVFFTICPTLLSLFSFKTLPILCLSSWPISPECYLEIFFRFLLIFCYLSKLSLFSHPPPLITAHFTRMKSLHLKVLFPFLPRHCVLVTSIPIHNSGGTTFLSLLSWRCFRKCLFSFLVWNCVFVQRIFWYFKLLFVELDFGKSPQTFSGALAGVSLKARSWGDFWMRLQRICPKYCQIFLKLLFDASSCLS